MKKKIVITAANGFIGRSLVAYFKDRYEVVALVRRLPADRNGISYRLWDGKNPGEWTIDLEGAFAVINLAGRSVNCRYNARNRSEIYASRLDSTALIGRVIAMCADKPEVWINASSATIYQHSLVPMTEKEGIIGEGFSVDVCRRWEKQFTGYSQDGVRQVLLRTAIVLGKNGGVMKPFTNLVKAGLGGRMASGDQVFSWIHEEDLCRAVDFLLESEACSGAFNLSAPFPVTNARFMKALRKKRKAPFGIPSPAWLLKIGAWLIGTETELIFKSRYVIPQRLTEAGFRFRYNTIDACLEDLVK